MNTPDLKNCPFCGGEALIVFDSTDKAWFIQCEECFAKSEGWTNGNASPEDLYFAIADAVEAAANAWNRRVTDANSR